MSGHTATGNKAVDGETAAETRIAVADWRVRLSLAENANYLYKDQATPGILSPLVATNGVVFPYTPNINIGYNANYEGTAPTHSNYKIQQYVNSAVDSITVTADFTCQDTFEANYLLACIHFFRSMTKMFYGQDENPKNGTPPPLGYFTGLGAFQLNNHPVAITNFAYNLPKDVDYIKATNSNKDSSGTKINLIGGQLEPGGLRPPANFMASEDEAITYVPTKIVLTITCVPVISRNDVSNKFSLKDYASGKLLRGNQENSGGMW
jgi:hypothetical protein